MGAQHHTRCGALVGVGPVLVPRLRVREAGSDWSVDGISARLGRGFGKGKLYHPGLYPLPPPSKYMEQILSFAIVVSPQNGGLPRACSQVAKRERPIPGDSGLLWRLQDCHRPCWTFLKLH